MIEPDWSQEQLRNYVAELPLWSGAPQIEFMIGGLCNTSFKVTDGAASYVARIGFDIPVHGIYQSSVQATAVAASSLGVTPRVVHTEPALIVADFATGGTVRAEHVADLPTLRRMVELARRLHTGSAALHPAVHYFSPFQIVRRYCQLLRSSGCRVADRFPELEAINGELERQLLPYTPVFTHNDIVPQNMVFDAAGAVLFVDWDYGGFGHPNFDLAGMLINADAPDSHDELVVESYYGQRSHENWHQYQLFKVMVALREYLWGLVQEATSRLAPELVAAGMSTLYADEKAGYEGYTEMNERRFVRCWEQFRRLRAP